MLHHHLKPSWGLTPACYYTKLIFTTWYYALEVANFNIYVTSIYKIFGEGAYKCIENTHLHFQI